MNTSRKPGMARWFAARALAVSAVAAVLLAGAAAGEVSREGLVVEWQYQGGT